MAGGASGVTDRPARGKGRTGRGSGRGLHEGGRRLARPSQTREKLREATADHLAGGQTALTGDQFQRLNLPAWQIEALELVARQRGLSTGQMIRRCLSELLTSLARPRETPPTFVQPTS